MQDLLKKIPKRTEKPREYGLSMVMDKGLGTRQAVDFLENNSNYTDIIKLGFGTSLLTPNVSEKVKELRVWYTGATRSKQTLHLLGTYHQYNFPLGKYFA